VSELYKAREDCRSVKKELEKTNMLTLDALLGDEQRRLIKEAAEVFGQTYNSLMLSLAHQIKNTAGFVGASPEKQLAIVASRLTKLEEEVQWR
jgi:adenylate kinase